MRLPRLYAPGEVQLVQVRFSAALASVAAGPGLSSTLDTIAGWLSEQIKAGRLALHAWSLTPSRLLLLVTPPNEQAIASAVQALGRRLGANLKVGVVFNGRYKTALIEPALFIPAQIWLESSPELDGYAVDAVTWRWSSAGIHTGAMALACPLAIPLTDHDKYWACGNTPFDRQATYLSLLREGLSGSQRQSIESAISGQWALGSTAYVTQIAKVASRRAAPGRRGRPPKAVL